MKRLVVISLAGLALAFAVVYASDFAIWSVRKSRNAGYGTVTVRSYYAVHEKNNRTEYVFGSAQDQPCTNSLFSHEGLRPCWYLRRHPEQQIEI